MPTRFDALKRTGAAGGDESSSSSSSDDDAAADDQPNAKPANFEDLSSYRSDEEMVLAAIYEDDFTSEEGVWGCARLNVAVRPPDTAQEHVGSEFTLSAQLGRKYPYVAPVLELRNAKGLTRKERQEVLSLLNARAHDCAATGSVAMCEIIQAAEDYLLEHNKDPTRATMSAWEQMKEREAAQEEAERKQREEQEAYRMQLLDDSSNQHQGRYELSSVDKSGGTEISATAAMEAERELQKQMETLDAAFADRKRIRKLHSDFIDEGEEEQSNAVSRDGEDFVDFDEDSDANDDEAEQGALMISTASRYKSDFIELGLLGRGGGGEVVKARNRLDRRVYAVKKIQLEPETGRNADVAIIHNRKLLREVTTISRMTHQNIVRYYQAWVEGGSASEKVEGVSEEESNEGGGDNQSNSDSSGDSSGGGFWKNSPALGPIQSGENDGSFDSSSGLDLGSPLQDGMNTSLADALHSQSTNAFLEHEFEDFRNPLFVGGALESRAYDALVTAAPTKVKSSATQSNDIGSGINISGLLEDDTSMKVDENAQTIFIQMEFCANTLRRLIDSGDVKEMKPIEVWRIARQAVEALSYIHGKSIIHRDLKPGNIFLDSQSNVRLGDFGLATLNSTSKRAGADAKGPDEDVRSEAKMIHDAVEDISGLLGGSSSRRKRSHVSQSSSLESLTGGVGTTFYRAPEQEGRRHGKGRAARDDTSYDMKADIFSFGILLFELFSEKFSTYMERAETLLRLRGENPTASSAPPSRGQNDTGTGKDWRSKAQERFPEKFLLTAPEAAQRIILWCIESRPEDRPSAEELLQSELLPKKLELESRYLQDALQILSNPQNESNKTILNYLFDRPAPPQKVFETDIALKARGNSHFELLAAALRSLGIYSLRDVDSLRSTALGSASCSQLAAILALKRARAVTKKSTGGSELLRGAPQRTAAAIAALSASSAAITGSADGLLGADPTLIERICETCVGIFKQHGATRLDGPLLRPRTDRSSRSQAFNEADNAMGAGGPAEVLNADGTVLLLPEDSTCTFARAVARGGCGSLKRFSMSKVFHRSLAGGHPAEKLEASFDIIQDDPIARAEVFEAETVFLVCQILATIDASNSSWFLRISHTRLADAILDVCGVPQKDSARRATLRILTACTAPSPTSWQNENASNAVAFKNYLEIAAERHGLPQTSVDRLRIIFTKACLPLPSTNTGKACDLLYDGIERLRQIDTQKKALSRGKLKRFDDAHRSLKSVRLLLSLMKSFGVQTSSSNQEKNHQISSPRFMSLDLGFRQRRKHYHGQLLFQAISVSDDYSKKTGYSNKHENLDVFLAGGGAMRLAEGGRYDELVRKCRPPGVTFGSSIPICTGVRLFIAALVEKAYRAAESAQNAQPIRRGSSVRAQIESIRGELGHPLPPFHPIKCLVVSNNGLDAASLNDRARVASILWQSGIPSEYTCNASALTDPLIHRSIAADSGATSDLSLEDLTGVSSILRIPFIVVAQPHLLREKGSVRLRHIVGEAFEEDFVPLEELASKIKEQLTLHETTTGAARSTSNPENGSAVGRQSSVDDNKTSSSAAIQCIYCDEAEYHVQQDLEKRKGSSSDKATAKAAKKELSRAMQKAEAYIDCLSASSSLGQGTHVIASALPYLILRDLGTALVTTATTSDAIVGVAARYPSYRRLLKTVGMSVDHAMAESTPSQKQRELLLYSITDDRFDLIQIGDKLKSLLLAPGSPDHRRHRSSSFDMTKGGKRR